MQVRPATLGSPPRGHLCWQSLQPSGCLYLVNAHRREEAAPSHGMRSRLESPGDAGVPVPPAEFITILFGPLGKTAASSVNRTIFEVMLPFVNQSPPSGDVTPNQAQGWGGEGGVANLRVLQVGVLEDAALEGGPGGRVALPHQLRHRVAHARVGAREAPRRHVPRAPHQRRALRPAPPPPPLLLLWTDFVAPYPLLPATAPM